MIFIGFPTNVSAEVFYLYYGTFESKERTNKIEDSPTLHARPFSSLAKCEAAGEKIFENVQKILKDEAIFEDQNEAQATYAKKIKKK